MPKAPQKVSESELMLRTPSGYVQQNPLIGIVNHCTDTITKLSREFGLTPASRTRLQAAPEPQGDSIEERMSGWLRERKASSGTRGG